MKTKLKPKLLYESCKKRLLAVLLFVFAGAELLQAQHPDCATGTYMYATFVNSAGSTTADSTEIRPVTYTTGAIGSLVGGRRYYIRKQKNNGSPYSGTYFYGSSAMGVDGITSRFYLMTQMASDGPFQKDIITINPLTPTVLTVIGTTPTSLNNYHFVKMAISPTGLGFAVGVNRDTSAVSSTFTPLIDFTTCGATPTTNCSTIRLLGYLASTGNSYKWKTFNGDIAFDAMGNLYFATAAFEAVNGIYRYTDARLFRINAANIPTSAGTGTIPMSFIADFTSLDSTIINGIAFNPMGSMFFSTRRFTGVQTSPAGPSFSELYGAQASGNAVQISPFAPITSSFNVSDLASCFFPATVLGDFALDLSGKYNNGRADLSWRTNNNGRTNYFEIQRSDNGTDFVTVGKKEVVNRSSTIQTYSFSDVNDVQGTAGYYRIKQGLLGSNVNYYSNVARIQAKKMSVVKSAQPNPFKTQIDINVYLRSHEKVSVALHDLSGRKVYSNTYNGKPGENKIIVNQLGNLKAGIYIMEFAAGGETIRERIVKE